MVESKTITSILFDPNRVRCSVTGAPLELRPNSASPCKHNQCTTNSIDNHTTARQDQTRTHQIRQARPDQKSMNQWKLNEDNKTKENTTPAVPFRLPGKSFPKLTLPREDTLVDKMHECMTKQDHWRHIRIWQIVAHQEETETKKTKRGREDKRERYASSNSQSGGASKSNRTNTNKSNRTNSDISLVAEDSPRNILLLKEFRLVIETPP
jgi:hypothetical protein